MADERNYLMVAALDFGTTYSGYAFSMLHEFKLDPLNIHGNQKWNAGSRALSSMKTPTCLLLTGNKEFVAFGYDAEAQYADKVMDGEDEDCYYFHRFKMNLHNNKNITQNMVLEDIRGKSLPAVTVFKFSISALVDHLMEMVQRTGADVRKHEIQWVLTVPAIWRDTAKQFMRTCAEEAGIPKDQLILALEPETASIFCQYLPTEKLQGSSSGFTMTETGTKYMVVDIGGGTADITVHQKASNGQLKELYRASGNDCGGTSVDKRFFHMLEQILGKEVMKDLKESDPLSYLDLEREFEAVKRTVDSKKTGKVNVVIPAVSLSEKCNAILQKDLKSAIGSSSYAGDIVLYNDKLRIGAHVIRDLFKPTVDSITSIMKDILRDSSTEGVTMLLMVGGFSECQLLQDAIRQEFPDKRIIIPLEAGMAVLNGAVLFGHRPDYIQSRVMRCSYGVKTNVPFDERRHDKKKKVIMEGEAKCDDIFSQIMEKDQAVAAGTKVRRSYFTPYKNQDIMDFNIYVSDIQYPSYVDDFGCYHLCKPTISFPDQCEEKRWVDVEFVFGNTEIGMKAVDRNSGKDVTSKINLI